MDSNALTKGVGALSKIDGDIKNFTMYAAH
jgi:hypothetical protein